MTANLDGPRFPPARPGDQAARRVPARLRGRRQRSDRARPAMAAADARRRLRVAARARALPRRADGPAMVRAEHRAPDDPRGAAERWQRRRRCAPAHRRLSRRRTRKTRPRRFAPRARRLQPGLDDGAARRPAPAARARRRSSPFPACWSGRSISARRRRADAKGEPPPVLLIHGDQDPLIPLEAMFAAMDALARADIPDQWHLAFGVGHGIDGGGPAPRRAVPRPGVRRQATLKERPPLPPVPRPIRSPPPGPPDNCGERGLVKPSGFPSC